jgi:predicted ribonuclease YlaK
LSNPVKTFVIDTNVFIHRPDAILSFRDNEIVVPLWVLEELDNLKKSREERGRNARERGSRWKTVPPCGSGSATPKTWTASP